MTRILGSIVIKNESDRYLDACLSWMRPFFDDVFVYDDRSDDDSPDIARSHGCHVETRSENVPSFLEHEAAFRFAAWQEFERVMSPTQNNDWILSFDADEFLVSKSGADVRSTLEDIIHSASRRNCVGVVLPFPEIFKVDQSGHYFRVDGYWGQIMGPRFFAYRLGATWKNKPMGCGSEPEYVAQGPLSHESKGLFMLHYGYAKASDQESKYKRYSSLAQHGHNDSHIESIIAVPQLARWDGQIPEIGLERDV